MLGEDQSASGTETARERNAPEGQRGWQEGTAGWPLKGHFQGAMQAGSWPPHPACGTGEAGIRGKMANGGQAGSTAVGSQWPSSLLQEVYCQESPQATTVEAHAYNLCSKTRGATIVGSPHTTTRE